MADFKGRKGFSDFSAAMKILNSQKGLARFQVAVVYGKSSWLAFEAVQAMRKSARKADFAVSSLEAKEVSDGKLSDIFSQTSLFEPSTLFVINKAEQATGLLTRLAASTLKDLPNKIALVLSSDRIPATLSKIMSSEELVQVPCINPWPNELPKAVEAFAGSEGLNLQPGAIQVLIETSGQDLQKIKNELVRLSLHFGNTEQALSRNDIAPFLGVLKEDDVYQLDRYLLEKKWPLASSLLLNLVDRGEKPLSILAMLANHCRNVLNICDGISKGYTAVEIGNRTRLPAFIMKNYLQSAKSVRVPAYNNALAACHHADMALKSRPIDEKMLLSQIVVALASVDNPH